MISCIGLASGIGGNNPLCGEGPLALKEHLLLHADWKKMIFPKIEIEDPLKSIAHSNRELAEIAFQLTKEEDFFVSFGGDHSSAIGVWSGVASALRSKGDLGLLWIDAHMDAHTPSTSESGNIHGMPLAALLGYGESLLTKIADPHPKIKPENLVLVGVRSFEAGEAKLLKDLNVRIFFMDEIESRGIEAVMKEALEIVTRRTIGFGVSFDLDSIDPLFVPGVSTPVKGGIHADEFLASLSLFREFPPLAFELVEYNPSLDTNLQSLPFVQQLMDAVYPMCSKLGF